MGRRPKLVKVSEEKKPSHYFPEENKSLEFIHTGCTTLDCALGGGWVLGRFENIIGDKSTGKCANDYYMLTPEGMVYSGDLEARQPLGLSEMPQDLALVKNQTAKATHFWKEEVDLTYKLTSSHGIELNATPDHKVQILSSEGDFVMRRVEDISIGDQLVIPLGMGVFSKGCVAPAFRSTKQAKFEEFYPPLIIDDTWGAWLGALIADGTTSSGPLVITAHKTWKRSLLSEWSEALFQGCYRTRLKDFVYTAQVKEYAEHLYGKSFSGSTARYKCVPKVILRSPKKVQAAFLRSLMNFDGELANGIVWSTASKRLAREVQLMLLNFGLFATMNQRVVKSTGWTYHSLSLFGKSFDQFCEEIGVLRPHTKKKLSIITTTNILSIPCGMSLIKGELNAIRKRVGWSKNGSITGGGRLPQLKAFCRQGNSASREYFAKCVNKLEAFSSPEFKEKARILLNPNVVFDPVVSKIEVKKKQIVSDVHVPEGHLFWANGLINHNTLLAIEACANFIRQYPNGKIWYREAEAAFDVGYAEELGLPAESVDFGAAGIGTPWNTIEDIFEDLQQIIADAKAEDVPGLYIVDSLDALSTRAALERKVGEGSFNLGKQKMIGELFQKLVREFSSTRVCIIFISQIREKINAMFGDKYTRAGGRALDFYATHLLWLSHLGTTTRTLKGTKRAVGVEVKAKCKKNKVGKPFREAQFQIQFGYGILDMEASLDFLEEVKMLDKLNLTAAGVDEYLNKTYGLPAQDLVKEQEVIRQAVLSAWKEVEERFAPTRRKYE